MRLALRQQVLIAALLAAVAAGVVAAIFFVANRGAEAVEFSAARLVPADAPLFVGLDTDLTHPQWVAAFNLARALGEPDPQARLRSLVLEEGDLDWERDVAPFLGGDAAFYLRSFDLDGDAPGLALIARCADVERALAIVEERAPYALAVQRHEGVEYRVDENEELFLARVDDYLVAATDRETLVAVLDVRAGRRPSLADDPQYAKLRKELAPDLLIYTYMHAGRLAEMGTDALAGLGFGLEPSANLSETGAVAVGFTARTGAFELRSVGAAVTGAAAEPLAARASRFVKMAPEQTAIFATTHGIDGSALDSLNALEGLGLGGGANGPGGPLAGLDLPFDPEDMLALLRLARGELAVAAGIGATGLAEPQALLLAEVRDEPAARRLLDRIVPAVAGGRPRATTVGGVPMYVLDSPAGEVAYAVTAGFLAAGTAGSVRAALDQNDRSLEQHTAYQRALLEIDTSLGSYLYVDLQGLLAALEEELPPGSEAFARAARSIVLNVVPEGGVSPATGVFVVQE